MNEDKIIITIGVVFAVLMVGLSVLLRLNPPHEEIAGQAFRFEIDGIDGVAYLLAKVAAPSVRQLSLEFEDEPEPEEEQTPEIPEISVEDSYMPESSETLEEPNLEPPSGYYGVPFNSINDDTDDTGDSVYMSDSEILLGIKNSVDGILICIMLLMSTGIVALILRIVYPLFRGGR